MRILLALCIVVVIMGGTALFMAHGPARAGSASLNATAPGPLETARNVDYALEITPTFDLAPDPFALNTGQEKPAGLTVSRDGQVILSLDQGEAGLPVLIEPLEGLAPGMNEFLIIASPPADQARAQALRARLLRNGLPLLERTFWSENGEPVTGVFQVDIAAEDPAKDDSHAQ